jgi:hypothetical protein
MYPPTPGQARAREDRGLVIAGWTLAILAPFVGLILGIIAATRERGSEARSHGVSIIVTAVIAATMWTVGLIAVIAIQLGSM